MFILLVSGLSIHPARAESWMTFYTIGHDRYAVDIDSVKRAQGLTRYRSGIVGEAGSVAEMQVDCTSRKRGQLPDPRMSSTYAGTLGGEEVAAVCKLADGATEASSQSIGASLNSTPDDASEFLSREDIRHFCEGVMGSIGSGNFAGTLQQIQNHLSASPRRSKELGAALNTWYVNTLVQLGDAQGSEFVRQDRFSETLVQVTYLAKYERGATRWVFLFYQRAQGWALIDVRSDADLQSVLDK